MRWTPHPILKLPTQAQALAILARPNGRAELKELHDRREELIEREAADPLRAGVKLDSWKRMREMLQCNDLLLILGGNRSSKTESCADLVVDTMVNGPFWKDARERARSLERGVRVACFHSSEQTSINQQQPYVHRYLPQEWRYLQKKTKRWVLKYSAGSGFTNNMFILPNLSECFFFHYTQRKEVFEGYEFDLAWCDELVPPEFVEVLEFRTATRDGKLVLSYTPVSGYSATCRLVMNGMQPELTRKVDPRLFKDGEAILSRRLARNCAPGEVPVTLRSPGVLSRKAVVLYHSDGNPFSEYENIVKRCQGKSIADVMIRAYGYTERSEAGAFPKFNPKAHVITRARFEELWAAGGTVYVSADPGGAKDWFVKWYFVTPQGWTIVFREWPTYDLYGDWAVPPKNERVDWMPGPAQFADTGGGIVRIKTRILEEEGWLWNEADGGWSRGPQTWDVELRLMDPRMGGTPAPSDDHETSLLLLMEEEQVDERGRVVGPCMQWEAASAGGSRAGRTATQISIELMNSRMAYNEDEPVSVENCPNWYVVEDCQHSIMAYTEYTGMGTDKDALKDIIDPDRYFVNADVGHVEPGDLVVRPRSLV